MDKEMSNYRQDLIDRFWAYQKEYFPKLDEYFDRRESPDGRPPVFLRNRAAHNILIDPRASQPQRELLVNQIPPRERHRWFRSMTSSQAIAQSVFGNLKLYDCLLLLNELTDDDGSRLFGEERVSADNFFMERKVDSLGEPQPTSLDGFISGDYRVAIECKLTESEVGSCSRPQLKEKASNYEPDFCEGTYTRQRGRTSRCSLTERGVLYWRFVSEVFRWSRDTNLVPCPLYENYQLVRNILAVAVRDGSASLGRGHVVLVYDERNPAYQPGGKGYRAFEETRSALHEPGMLKRCSWQRIVQVVREKSDLQWLAELLEAKYGF